MEKIPFAEKKAFTFYLTNDDRNMLDGMYIELIQQGQKTTYSEILSEAIAMLYHSKMFEKELNSKEVMEDRKALQHAIAWAIQSIYNANKEAMEILENKDMSEADKTLALRGPHGIDYKMLNLICMLKPLLPIAKEEYPEQTQFFEWFDDKWKVIEEGKMLSGACGCKGCKIEEPTKNAE